MNDSDFELLKRSLEQAVLMSHTSHTDVSQEEILQMYEPEIPVFGFCWECGYEGLQLDVCPTCGTGITNCSGRPGLHRDEW